MNKPIPRVIRYIWGLPHKRVFNTKTQEFIEIDNDTDAETLIEQLGDIDNWELQLPEERGLLELNPPTSEQLRRDREDWEYFMRPREIKK